MTTSTEQLASITESFEYVSEDLNQHIIERYHELCPDAAGLMSHMDEHMCGRMLEEVFLLVLGSEDFESWIDFELTNHESYGVRLEMYTHLFQALLDVIRGHLQADWTPAWQSAWEARIEYLLSVINRRNAA